ncbi:hypothetical protein NPIL_146941 [Nephila pilipes]|uniref:Uncharacterized protein n=1 Tax=Nephila pilipes TaxID=299642 RepID=A0A8X6U0W3_NEPPI|nr:hypothetical protein NPIL_146941 [Nephila pilipes]
MYSEILAKTILCAWMWCLMRLLIFNIYDIAYMLPFLIILDQIATTSSTLTSIGSTGSKTIGYAAQEDPKEKKEENICTKGNEETSLNELISKLMYMEKQKAMKKMKKLIKIT